MCRMVLLLTVALTAQTCFAPLAAQEREVVGELGLYHQTFIEDGEMTPRFFLEGSHLVAGPMGVWGFGDFEKEYVSAVAGLYLDLIDTDKFGFSIGVGGGSAFYPGETGEWGLEGRYAAFAETSSGPVTLSAYYENGESEEVWYQGLLEIRASNLISVGAIAQKDDGVGPKFAVHVPTLRTNIWVAPMFSEGGGQRVLLGAELVIDALR